jgi:hypothetical protein
MIRELARREAEAAVRDVKVRHTASAPALRGGTLGDGYATVSSSYAQYFPTDEPLRSSTEVSSGFGPRMPGVSSHSLPGSLLSVAE